MKQRRVVFAPEAREDILAIYHWIADAASEEVALRYVERLESWCLGFELAAERGHARDDIRPGLRIAGFERRVTLAFTVSDERVTIVRLFWGGRDWQRELG